MPAFLRLSGFTREDRFGVTARITEALSAAGGWIVDHHQFSNVSLCINFEIDAQHLERLAAVLATTGLRLSDESNQALRTLRVRSHDEIVMGTLQATFLHNEPDERVPGPLG